MIQINLRFVGWSICHLPLVNWNHLVQLRTLLCLAVGPVPAKRLLKIYNDPASSVIMFHAGSRRSFGITSKILRSVEQTGLTVTNHHPLTICQSPAGSVS